MYQLDANNVTGPQPQHLGHNTTCGSETTWRWTCKCL